MRSFWQAWFDAGKFAFEVQTVMMTRIAKLATGRNDRELQRMISEKFHAFVDAQIAMFFAFFSGAAPKAIMLKAHAPYRRRVSANRRRLMR